MEGSVYSSLGLRMKRTYRERQELLSLKDFLEHKFVIQNQDELKKIFVKDLKNALEKENLFDLIQGFFDLETDLQTAFESASGEKLGSFFAPWLDQQALPEITICGWRAAYANCASNTIFKTVCRARSSRASGAN